MLRIAVEVDEQQRQPHEDGLTAVQDEKHRVRPGHSGVFQEPEAADQEHEGHENGDVFVFLHLVQAPGEKAHGKDRQVVGENDGPGGAEALDLREHGTRHKDGEDQDEPAHHVAVGLMIALHAVVEHKAVVDAHQQKQPVGLLMHPAPDEDDDTDEEPHKGDRADDRRHFFVIVFFHVSIASCMPNVRRGRGFHLPPQDDIDRKERGGKHASGRVADPRAEAEAFICHQDIGHADRRHERGGDGRQQAGAPAGVGLQQIRRGDPEGDHRQRLVAPGKIAPQHVEIQLRQHRAHPQKRQGDDEAVENVLLVQLRDLRQDQPGGAEGGVAGGDGAGDDAHDGKHTAYRPQHPGGDVIDCAGLPQR